MALRLVQTTKRYILSENDIHLEKDNHHPCAILESVLRMLPLLSPGFMWPATKGTFESNAQKGSLLKTILQDNA